jgi:hypothetical protein
MTRTAVLWIGLATLYAAFLAWHQPILGPLTEREVRAAFGDRFAQMRAAGDHRAARLIDFFLTDDGQPFYMANLNALAEDTAQRSEAARTYASYMGPRLLLRASYPVLSTDLITTLNNSLEADLDAIERLVVVRYRSRRDFLEIITAPEFRQAVEYKIASLDGWYSAPSSLQFVILPPQLVLIALTAIGLIGSWLNRPKRRRGARPETARVLDL